MHSSHRPALNLITTSSPARPVSTSPSPHSQSQSPFRYVQYSQELNEKDTHSLHPESKSRSPSAGPSTRRLPSPLLSPPSQPAPLFNQRLPYQSQPYTRPRALRISNLIRAWLPIILYALTSLGFLVAIAFYKVELFAALDELSRWLQADPVYGQAVLFLLIFLTTFPPIPLYSTLIILSGYTFGAVPGAVVSYFAALSGAIVVFMLSRTLLRESITRWLASTKSLQRVVRAIEKRPKLLFLIRLAPYPYNVMNCLLAASPTLTLRTYTMCTALSLFKVIVHSSVGASIHSFRDYHVVAEGTDSQEQSRADSVARMWTIFGILLCVGIFVYLSYVARKAVDEELEDECSLRQNEDDEERVAFLSPRGTGDLEQGCDDAAEEMTESNHQLISPRPSISLNGDDRSCPQLH